MKRDVEVARPPPTGPSDLGTQFVQSAARRLGLVALTVALAVGSGVLMNAFGHEVLGWGRTPPLWRLGGSLLLLGISLGVFWLSRTAFDPRRLLNLGLVYYVVGALPLVLPRYLTDKHLQENAASLGWLGVWILLFPLLVPGKPLKTVAASLLAATSAPAAYLVMALVEGRPLAGPRVFIQTFFPYYFCAGLAILPAFLIHSLGRAISSAQRQVRQLGSYQLTELLGQGGMGEVWRAEHQMLARPAAIKLIKPDRLSSGTPAQRSAVQERFEREAKATAALSSPHTVGLFDYGSTSDGVLYYVMEMLDGIDLESLVKTFGLVSPARTIHLLAQACESLAEAHHAGLIHRDVKPANIMACRKGQRLDFVKVLDFGLVRLGRDPSRDQVSLTDAHLIGTPAFMAPEQALCRKDLDARADVYALGAVGFWLLTGTYVFESESTVAMLTDVIRSDPLPPSARGAQAIPEDLDALILSCLAKHPGERPESAAVLRERLLACDVPPWTQADAQAWWDERQPATGGADADATTLTAQPPAWHDAPTDAGAGA